MKRVSITFIGIALMMSALGTPSAWAKKVPGTYLELPNGGHGLSGYRGPSWEAWKTQSLQWLRDLKMFN